MKNYLFLFFLLLISLNLFAQIKTRSIISNNKIAKKENNLLAKYDSTKNFLGSNYSQYIGQLLYLRPKPKSLKKYGYSDFYKNITEVIYESKNIYKLNNDPDSYNSKHDELAGLYFKVLKVGTHKEIITGDTLHFLKLQEQNSKDITYYIYNIKYKYSFPFIVVGYYEKLKEKYIGEKFSIREKNSTWKTLSSQDTIVHDTGDIYTCKDVIIEDKNYSISLIFDYKGKSEFPVYIERGNSKVTFSEKETKKYLNKFGANKWKAILRGEPKVGMSREALTLAKHTPSKDKIKLVDGLSFKKEVITYKDVIVTIKDNVISKIEPNLSPDLNLCFYKENSTDEFTKSVKKILYSKEIFTYNSILSCNTSLASIDNSKIIYFNINIHSANAHKIYGYLKNESKIIFKLKNDETVTLKIVLSDMGDIDYTRNKTQYKVFCTLSSDALNNLESSNTEKVRIYWSKGYQDYEINNPNYFANNIKCIR